MPTHGLGPLIRATVFDLQLLKSIQFFLQYLFWVTLGHDEGVRRRELRPVRLQGDLFLEVIIPICWAAFAPMSGVICLSTRTSSCSLDCGELIDRNLVAKVSCRSPFVASLWWSRVSYQPQTWRKWHSPRRRCLLVILLLSCLQTFQCRLLLGNNTLAWRLVSFPVVQKCL